MTEQETEKSPSDPSIRLPAYRSDLNETCRAVKPVYDRTNSAGVLSTHQPRIARPVQRKGKSESSSYGIRDFAVVLTLEPRNFNNLAEKDTRYKSINDVVRTPWSYEKLSRIVSKILDRELGLPEVFTERDSAYGFIVEFQYEQKAPVYSQVITDTITVTMETGKLSRLCSRVMESKQPG